MFDTHFGPTFKSPWFYMGIILTIALIYIGFSSHWLVFLFCSIPIVASVYLALFIVGIRYDFEKDRYKNYLLVLQLKLGGWKDASRYTYIHISRLYVNQQFNYRSISTSTQVQGYEVSMMDSYKNKVLLDSFDGLKNAVEFAERFSENSGKTLLKYDHLIPKRKAKKSRLRK